MNGCRCYLCQGELSWMSSFSSDELGYEVPGTVSMLKCRECGAEYEIFVAEDVKDENR